MKRYKVGDKVWIREDLELNRQYGGMSYQINSVDDEIDIRGKQVTITLERGHGSYNCVGYKIFNLIMIDHEKTNNTDLSYEIY